jgi:glutamate-ammonia-ligase adenylyltransferase
MASTPPESYQQAVDSFPALLRDPALRWFERLDAAGGSLDLTDRAMSGLAKLVTCSEYAGGVVLRDWRWFTENVKAFDSAPDEGLLDDLITAIGARCTDADEAKARIRQFRNRWMVHVLWRQLSGDAGLDETLASQSLLADRLLDAATQFAARAVQDRFGIVRLDNGSAAPLVVLGMGKLGGTELNFSSDIDIIFLYPGGADSDGRKALSAHEYFARIARHVVALLDEVTADGFAFRVDTRLRPFGESGPPVTSFSALETYLLQHGRYWERYAYVKARVVGQQPPDSIVRELMADIVRPFVYRRYLDFGVFEALREMHAMISADVQRREMADNVKLGPGGIREIEFIVQSLQLVRGGSHPELQESELLIVLERLVGRHGLEETAADALEAAYRFLRRLENFIQALRDRQTHELPVDESDRARLCLAMDFADWGELLAELDRHRDRVSQEFNAIAFRGQDAGDHRPKSPLTGLWERGARPEEWSRMLDRAGFEEAEAVAERLVQFAAAPTTRQISSVARQRLDAFIPELLDRVRACSSQLVALNRVLAIVEKILRRSAYLALLNENAEVLSRLVDLCEHSSFIAGQVARYPVLLDELLDPSVGSTPLTLDELDAELDERLAMCSADDSEEQVSILGQFQRASLFRIAVADVTGSLPIMKVSDSLTWLAEAVLRHALQIAWHDLVARHGAPHYVLDGERLAAGFAIIAYGKLGGLEMSYGSDLDLVFLHDSSGQDRNTTGPKSIDNTMFFTRLVRRLTHFLTAQTGSGMLYEVDTRLRPDGQSGVMVSSIEAFERYQEDNAWTWEHQALLRARPVAGSQSVGDEFQRIRAQTLASRVRRDRLRDDVVKMRRRMRASLDKSSEDVFDLKQGAGGIGDIEFIVQYLVLANAADDASLYFYSDNIRQLEALAAAGILADETARQLQEIYKRYRLRLHHLALDEKTALTGAEEFAEERRYVEALWKEVL